MHLLPADLRSTASKRITAMNIEQRRRILGDEIEHCHKYPGMNEPGKTPSGCRLGFCRVGDRWTKAVPTVHDAGNHFTKGSRRPINESLDGVGINKRDIFIAKVVHRHPPKNRKSYRGEIDMVPTHGGLHHPYR